MVTLDSIPQHLIRKEEETDFDIPWLASIELKFVATPEIAAQTFAIFRDLEYRVSRITEAGKVTVWVRSSDLSELEGKNRRIEKAEMWTAYKKSLPLNIVVALCGSVVTGLGFAFSYWLLSLIITSIQFNFAAAFWIGAGLAALLLFGRLILGALAKGEMG
jgi:hypothetical protein